jgi:hypothetical protein
MRLENISARPSIVWVGIARKMTGIYSRLTWNLIVTWWLDYWLRKSWLIFYKTGLVTKICSFVKEKLHVWWYSITCIIVLLRAPRFYRALQGLITCNGFLSRTTRFDYVQWGFIARHKVWLRAMGLYQVVSRASHLSHANLTTYIIKQVKRVNRMRTLCLTWPPKNCPQLLASLNLDYLGYCWKAH